MQYSSTLFLRITIVALGAIALTIAWFVLPAIWRGWAMDYAEVEYLRYPLVASLGMSLVPFFVALVNAWKLLNYFDRNKAFSQLSVNALRRIKYAAAAFSGLYIFVLPGAYYMAEVEDAPGLIVLGMIMILAPLVIAGFAAVLQRLLQQAVDIKSENDLTV